ncbi:FkbM family methyltransferase [Patescibacteria group bacterium]|nr:FkbM family methyltransferase [Patescibacteria group bacterium]
MLKKILNIKKYPFCFKILKNKFLPISYKKSYSQLGEDLIVGFIFQNLKIENPTYIDIGANDPIKLNNTYFLYKKGAPGICIEPNPNLFKQIKNKRRRDICLNIRIGTEENKKANYYIMNSDVLNTFSKEEAEGLIKNTNQKIEKIIQIPLLPLRRVVTENFKRETPNFISLDTEGYDFEILKSIDFKNFRPEVFCVETLTYTEDKAERKEKEVIDFMVQNGYYVHSDTYVNTIFVDKNKCIKENWKNFLDIKQFIKNNKNQ